MRATGPGKLQGAHKLAGGTGIRGALFKPSPRCRKLWPSVDQFGPVFAHGKRCLPVGDDLPAATLRFVRALQFPWACGAHGMAPSPQAGTCSTRE